MIPVVNVGYDSTNYYVLGSSAPRLLIDVGWPGTLPKLEASLKRKGIAIRDIGYLMATHYHPDHAGLAQELKGRGVRLIVLASQVTAIAKLKTYMKPGIPYVDIATNDNLLLALDQSRAFLREIGLAGTIVATPGHSDDSVTLVLDSGQAFSGDLAPPDFAVGDAREAAIGSWSLLRSLGVTELYPGHGPIRPFPSQPAEPS